jgi:Ser/Thr protein kinase RdoA (MazF antagonist)
MSADAPPPILREAWDNYALLARAGMRAGHAVEARGAAREPHEDAIVGYTETSAGVSTNRVYHLTLASGRTLFAKVSSYGSYVHFRQDHQRIHQWINELRGSRYERFLAPVLLLDGEVFTFERDAVWVVFYEEAQRRGVLPRVLSDAQIQNLGREMAEFHRASAAAAARLSPTWQSLGADLATLYDHMQSSTRRASYGLDAQSAQLVRRHCDLFFTNAERLGYHSFAKLPVLTDWNRGNFSVAYDEQGFSLYSRWDYDWFRIEPRGLDFYFFSRVVRSEGDQTVFSYTASPLLEPRFFTFLRAYHEAFALEPAELAFLKEAYRFFLLNYVVRTGEHFFLPEFHQRLARETVGRYLPELEQLDFAPLLGCLD